MGPRWSFEQPWAATLHEYLDPPLQGYRLVGDRFVQIATDASGCLKSQELGLRLCPAGGLLQFYRLDTGERLLARGERAEREAERADREGQARQAMEAELARLREELAKRT